jgi:hypothetical protein
LAFDYVENTLFKIINHHQKKLISTINHNTITSLLWLGDSSTEFGENWESFSH